MNGHRAKSLRRAIYKDLSLRQRKYSILKRGWRKFKWFIGKSEKSVSLQMFQVVNTGARREYQRAKREYKDRKTSKVIHERLDLISRRYRKGVVS